MSQFQSPAPTPDPTRPPVETAVVALVCATCLLGSAIVVACIRACKSCAPPPMPAAQYINMVSSDRPDRHHRQPPRPARALHVVAVVQPDGEYAVGTRAGPDKKMCAAQQHTPPAWAGA